MKNDALERAFDEFLEHEAYDRAQGLLFAVARASFLAGWSAATRADLRLIQNDGDTSV